MASAPAAAASAPAADKPRVAARSAVDKTDLFKRRADASVSGDAAAESAPGTEVSATAGDRASAAAAEGSTAAAGGGSVAKGALQAANVGSQAGAANGAQAAATDGKKAATAGGPKHPADPKAWLRQIDALRAGGKIELADAEMGRFRAAFPGYAAKPASPASSEPPK